MRAPVDVFDDWARKDKDKGMETGHRESVDAMLAFALEKFETPFRFIDAGCGNGWVKRLVEQAPLCSHAQGVDGAPEMINKANGKRTIPQIFFDDQHIGGYDEVRALEKEDKLEEMLK